MQRPRDCLDRGPRGRRQRGARLDRLAGARDVVVDVATDPDLRAKGFGRAIMNAAEDWLRAAGIAKLQLLVRPENAGVAAFYQSIGYGEQKILFLTKWLDGREPTQR